MIEVRKAVGDTLEYHKVGPLMTLYLLTCHFLKDRTSAIFFMAAFPFALTANRAVAMDCLQFYKSFCAQLKDIIWKSAGEAADGDLGSPVSGSPERLVPSKYQRGQVAPSFLSRLASGSKV